MLILQLINNNNLSNSSSDAADIPSIIKKEKGRWYKPNDFSATLRLNNSQNLKRSFGIVAGTNDADQELYLRQKAALQAQVFGNRLRLKQICINSAIVCMHRMFMIHEIQKFSSNAFVAAALFLAAKIEEVPIGLDMCAQLVLAVDKKLETVPHPKSHECEVLKHEIVALENAILHTLAFDFDFIHPHYMILNYCKKLNLSKEITKLAYTLGTYILILSNLCVRYGPSCLACVCINLAYKCIKSFNDQTIIATREEGEMDDELEKSKVDILENDYWVKLYEPSLDKELLENLTIEYFKAIHRTPNDLKKSLVNQTFSKAEPGYKQIEELMLNHTSRQSIWNLISSSNDKETSNNIHGNSSKKYAYNKSSDKSKNESQTAEKFLTREQWERVDTKLTSFLSLQKSQILQHGVPENTSTNSHTAFTVS